MGLGITNQWESGSGQMFYKTQLNDARLVGAHYGYLLYWERCIWGSCIGKTATS